MGRKGGDCDLTWDLTTKQTKIRKWYACWSVRIIGFVHYCCHSLSRMRIILASCIALLAHCWVKINQFDVSSFCQKVISHVSAVLFMVLSCTDNQIQSRKTEYLLKITRRYGTCTYTVYLTLTSTESKYNIESEGKDFWNFTL